MKDVVYYIRDGLIEKLDFVLSRALTKEKELLRNKTTKEFVLFVTKVFCLRVTVAKIIFKTVALQNVLENLEQKEAPSAICLKFRKIY